MGLELFKLLFAFILPQKRELPAPLFVPEGEVFRPRKQDIEQLQERDFLGKPKVHCCIKAVV